MYAKSGTYVSILLVILIGFCGKIEGATVTCEPEYGFLPCTSETWGRLFLIVVYQYLIALAQSYVSEGSNKFFGLVGPGIFGASLFHIIGNFPSLYLVLQSGLSSNVEGAAYSTGMGMSMLTGSIVMNLTLIWPTVITFGSYSLSDDDDDDDSDLQQSPEDEPSFFTRLTAYGVKTDNETSYSARIMLASVIPFTILQLPSIINSTSITRVILLIALILVVSLYITYVTYQMFQPLAQNRIFEYVTQQFVKSKLETLLSTNGKPNARIIKEIYTGVDVNHDGQVSKTELKTLLVGMQLQSDGEISDDFVEKVMEQFDVSGDEFIQEDEFVRVMTKWLRETRKSASRDDFNPLRFFIKRNGPADEEEQTSSLIPKESPKPQISILEYLEALSLVLFGTAVTILISTPLTTDVWTFASNANVPSFLIPYFVIPCFSSISRILSTIKSASQKTERAASLTLSQSKLERPLRKKMRYGFIQRQLKRESEARLGNCIRQITHDCKEMLKRKMEEIELYNSTINKPQSHNILGRHKCFNCRQRGLIIKNYPVKKQNEGTEIIGNRSETAKVINEGFMATKHTVILKYPEWIHFETKCMIKGTDQGHWDNICQQWDTFRGKFDKVVKWFYKSYLEKALHGPIPPKINGVQIHLFDLYKLIEGLGGYLSVYFGNEFGTIGEILGPSKQDGEEVKKCYIKYLDVFTSYYKTTRVPNQEYRSNLDMPTKILEEGKEYTCLASHQCAFAEIKAPNMEAAKRKGKEKIEHFGVRLEDLSEKEYHDSQQLHPIQPNRKE
uniref:Sodium/calcium exchanger NCL2-like n=1 Tax=Tanacetum cinerariifolium TaxID=118510 RepID=A0A6L2MKT9_TANCI|nr:sodium/calcium exchanger NCL2-like [Tanacetum cinerariifolium]